MKMMIASDLHGVTYYCQKLLEAFERENAERLLLLGDILDYGSRNALSQKYNPKSVIAQLNRLKAKILCVRGNCDTEGDQMVLDFPILADYCLLYVGSRMIFATHGHLYNERKLPPLSNGDILLHGHTHVPACNEHEGYTYVNPGSVSIPRDGSENSYILLTDNRFEWKTLDSKVYREFVL